MGLSSADARSTEGSPTLRLSVADCLALALAGLLAAACGGGDGASSGSTESSSSGGPLGGEAAVSVYSYGPPKDRFAMVASYNRVPDESFCTAETLGDCTVRECTRNQPQGLAVAAGRITATVGGREVTITPTAAGAYPPPANNDSPLFQGGETVSFQVEGRGDVPSHSASVVAPAAVVLSAPDPTKPIVIDRANDLLFTWTGGKDGDLLFATGAQLSDGSLVSLTCMFPGAAGTATLPSATLERLPSGNGATSIAYFWVIGRTEIDAGPWHTAFSALAEVLDAKGNGVAPEVTIQ